MEQFQIETVLKAAHQFGQAMSQVAEDLHKSFRTLGDALVKILPITEDPHGWYKTWERQEKRLARRERYIRRYRQRGERMKSGKTRFHKARHKRF